MLDLVTAQEANRRSIAEFIALAREVVPAAWNSEPAPGKWSPAQVTEHVALAYEQTRALLKNQGAPGGAPRLLRPLIRYLYVRPILQSGKFPANGKAPRQFRPGPVGEPAESLCRRLETAATGLESDLERLQSEGKLVIIHPIFGRIPLGDTLQFQAFHTTHHRQQLPSGKP